MFYDLARSARDLLNVDSTRDSGPGSLLGRVTDLLFYGDFEIFEQVASISESDHTNVVGYKAGAPGGGGLLLSAPLGSLPRSPRSKDAPPAALRDGRVWGAGAMSGRLALLCQIMAATSFPRGDLVRPVMVAGTFGQEHRGSGTRFLLESGNVQPQWVVVGAGTNLELVRAHRGYMVFEIELEPRGDQWRVGFPVGSAHRIVVPGVSAASVLPGAGVSALDRTFAILDDLADVAPLSVHGLAAGEAANRVPDRCSFDLLSASDALPPLPPDVRVEALPDDASVSPGITKQLAAWRTLWQTISSRLRGRERPSVEEFEPAAPLANVGQLVSEGARLTAVFDYRPLPGEDPYALFQEVAQLTEEASNAAGAEVAAELRVTINRPPMDLPDDGPLVDAARRAVAGRGLLPAITTLPHYTDGAMYAACDVDALVVGPGWWADDAAFGEESVPLQHLELAVEIYRDIIAALCT